MTRADELLAEVERKRQFAAGYMIAVANIVNLHGEDTIAEDVLAELGESEAMLRKLNLSDYDAKPLRKLFREIRRKQKVDRDRRARALAAIETGAAA